MDILFLFLGLLVFSILLLLVKRRIRGSNAGLFLVFSLVSSVVFLNSCSSGQRGSLIDEELFIPVPEAELYLRMRGTTGKPLLINLHGGPGGFSAIDIPLTGPYLEPHFLIAYLDQRGCGKSTGTDREELLTTDQYVEDLDIVVDSIRSRYSRENVNLMGTSWGGMYGFLYLLEHQDKVNSFICIDGKVNSAYQNRSLIEFELNRVDALLKKDIGAERRTELLEIRSELLRIKNSDFSEFYHDVNLIKHVFPPKLGFNAYFADTSKIIKPADVLEDSSMLATMNYTVAEYEEAAEKAGVVNAAFRNNPHYNNLNITEQLKQIEVPVLIIQGEKDYVVGVRHGELIYNALSSVPSDKKELHMLPDVGHSPAIEAPDTLARLIKRFSREHR